MKKYIIVGILLLLAIFFPTDSKNGSVMCESDNERDTMKAYFKDNKIQNIEINLKKYYVDEDDAIKAMNAALADTERLEGYSWAKITADLIDNNTVKIYKKFETVDMIEEEIIENLGTLIVTKGDFIKYAEQEGLTCK